MGKKKGKAAGTTLSTKKGKKLLKGGSACSQGYSNYKGRVVGAFRRRRGISGASLKRQDKKTILVLCLKKGNSG